MPDPTGSDTTTSVWSHVLTAVWRARWPLLVAAVVAGVAGYLISDSRPPTYVADSQVLLSSSHNFDPLSGQNADSTRFVANQTTVIATDPILTMAAARLDDGTTAHELGKALTVRGATADDRFTVSVSAGSPRAAAARANAVVAAYQQWVTQQVARAADAAAAATTDKAAINQIRSEQAVYGDGVAVVQPATPPTAPSAPKPMQDAALFAVIAALLVGGVALRVTKKDSVAAAADMPLLGHVPVPLRSGVIFDPTHFSQILVGLEYAHPDPFGVLLITGIGPDSGAASVAYGLAVAAAAQGRRVLLVDAEPGRRPLVGQVRGPAPTRSIDTLPERVGTADFPGLRLPAGSPGEVRLAALGREEGLPVPTSRASLSRLAREFDVVIVQTAPPQTSSLAFALLGQADAIAVACGARDKPESVTALQRRLHAAHRSVAGVVSTRRIRKKGSPAVLDEPIDAPVDQPASWRQVGTGAR